MKETIPLIDWRHGYYKLIPTKLGKQVWVQTRLILLYSSSLASQKQAEVSAPAVRAQLEWMQTDSTFLHAPFTLINFEPIYLNALLIKEK